VFALKVAALARYFASALGIATPPIAFFAEMTPELETPWLERIQPELRASYFFRRARVHGFVAADDARIWINVDEVELVDTIAHEVAHVAGYDEQQARAYGRRAATNLRGG